MADMRVVKGTPSVHLGEEAFAERFKARFHDQEFDVAGAHIDALLAWKTYCEHPRTRKAGAGFADPDYEMNSIEESKACPTPPKPRF